MTRTSTYSAYRFVKSNRKKKRRELNQMALRILLDKTTAFYLAIFGLMFSFWLRDQFVLYQPTFDWIEVLLSDNFFSVVSLRSEEHTSELQSRGHLICRLLLD